MLADGWYTFQPHFVADNLKELVKQGTVFVVVQDFLLGVLAIFDVDDAHLQLGFDEDLWGGASGKISTVVHVTRHNKGHDV
jgi:hypothetical protein